MRSFLEGLLLALKITLYPTMSIILSALFIFNTPVSLWFKVMITIVSMLVAFLISFALVKKHLMEDINDLTASENDQ